MLFARFEGRLACWVLLLHLVTSVDPYPESLVDSSAVAIDGDGLLAHRRALHDGSTQAHADRRSLSPRDLGRTRKNVHRRRHGRRYRRGHRTRWRRPVYLQIEVEAQARTMPNMIVANNRIIRFKRMPFGLKNAGATCQRAATIIFPDERARKYADDCGHAPRSVDQAPTPMTPQMWAVTELLRVILRPGMAAG